MIYSEQAVVVSTQLLFENKSVAEQMNTARATFGLCGVFVPIPEPDLADEKEVARLVRTYLEEIEFAEEIGCDRLRNFARKIEQDVKELVS